MDYSAEDLPPCCLEALNAPGNFATRNKQFRTAVCQHLKLEWRSVGGTGNCLFESVIVMLRAEGICPDNYFAHQLRLDVVDLFRECSGSTQDFCERVIIEIESELTNPLVCSTHAMINGRRVNGFAPDTVGNYLHAVASDGVWAQGHHWLRAISFLYDVRVAVVIYGNSVVRFFGQGRVTIYLYKVDAETHYDPLMSLAPDAAVGDGAGECAPLPIHSVHSRCSSSREVGFSS